MLKSFEAEPHELAGSWIPYFLFNLTAEYLDILVLVGFFSALGLLVGFRARLMSSVVFIVFLLTQNYWFLGTAFHDDWLYFTFPLLVFCFARSADAWSIDAWLKARKKAIDTSDPQAYRWPIEAGVFWFGFNYLAAGLAKILPLDKGLIWLTGVSTQEFSIQFMQQSPMLVIFDGTPFDYSILWPFALASIATVILEMGCAIVWFTDRYRLPLIGAVICMHFGIYLMGIPGFIQLGLVLGVALIPSRWFNDCDPETEKHLNPPAIST